MTRFRVLLVSTECNGVFRLKFSLEHSLNSDYCRLQEKLIATEVKESQSPAYRKNRGQEAASSGYGARKVQVKISNKNNAIRIDFELGAVEHFLFPAVEILYSRGILYEISTDLIKVLKTHHAYCSRFRRKNVLCVRYSNFGASPI